MGENDDIDTETQHNNEAIMPIKDPNNPLYGKEYRGGKKYTRYNYTTLDVAKLTGRSIGTIRNDIASGKLVMSDLLSVSGYVAAHAL